ncbi:MAG: hypothetical protein LIO92_07465 [Clostridiales bacterium]|nr:hypothetical protein [Clostridiales bacterium]
MTRSVKMVMTMIMMALMVQLMSFTALADGWTPGDGENNGRWQYSLEDGTYYSGTQETPLWQWIDGDQDGVAECYAFDEYGWMYADTQTPDGYLVNEDGAWVEDGIVQTISTNSSGTDQLHEDTDIDAEVDSEADSRILIAYFSRTNTTKAVAESIQQQTGGTLFEIQASDPYPSSYSETTARAQREINAGTLPEIVENVTDMDSYEIVFIGYPIWWGTTPPVVNTFMNSNDFSGKTVIPFCTSGGSGISGSLSNIREYCSGANILSGRDLTGASTDSIRSWLINLGVLQ